MLYFRRALRLDGAYLAAWTLMGHEYVELKNTAAAADAYRRAVSSAAPLAPPTFPPARQPSTLYYDLLPSPNVQTGGKYSPPTHSRPHRPTHSHKRPHIYFPRSGGQRYNLPRFPILYIDPTTKARI